MVKTIRTQNINNVITSNLNITSLSLKSDDLKGLVTDILITAELKLGNTFPVSQFHMRCPHHPDDLDLR